MKKSSNQQKMITLLLASPISDSKWQLKNRLYTNEIPMRQSSHQPKMNIWVFHVAIKKQIIYT
jgi:hypothetical protein